MDSISNMKTILNYPIISNLSTLSFWPSYTTPLGIKIKGSHPNSSTDLLSNVFILLRKSKYLHGAGRITRPPKGEWLGQPNFGVNLCCKRKEKKV